MTRLLQSAWINCLVGGVLYFGTTILLFTPAGTIQTTAEAETPRSRNNEVSWKFHNPEFEQWITELKHEKDVLAVKEQQLADLEKRVQIERLELTTVTQMVHQLQVDFDKTVIRFKVQETENLKRQAKLMTAMTPETACAMFKEMADDDLVRLLFLMKNDQVSELLETMAKEGKETTKRATLLTERLRLVLPAETPRPSSL